MSKIVYTFDDAIAAEINSKAKGKNNLDASMYARNGASSEITVDDNTIREVIRGEDGVFKDVTSNISDIGKIQKTGSFIFLQAGDYVYSVKRDSFTEGSEDELIRLVKNGYGKKSKEKTADKVVKFDRKAQKNYWSKINKDMGVRKRVPLKEKFRVPITVGLMAMLLSVITVLDPFNHIGYMSNNPITLQSLLQIPFSFVGGFLFGFEYIFFRMWFDYQKESTRVVSLIFFPFTFAIFGVISMVGTIPYIIYLLVVKSEGDAPEKIVRGSFKVVAIIIAAMFLVGLAMFYFLF